MELNEMTKARRVFHFATAPRAYAGTVCQLENGDFRTYWVGKLRGRIVSRPDGAWKFHSRAEAVDAARQFRELARSEMANPKQSSNAQAHLPPERPKAAEGTLTAPAVKAVRCSEMLEFTAIDRGALAALPCR